MSTDTTEQTPSAADPLPDEVLDDVIGSPRRRRLLAAALSSEEPVPVVVLARRVVAAERGVDPAAVDPDEVEAAKAAIYEEHLPKLTALRILSFDSQVAGVTPAENAPAVRDRLDRGDR